MSENVETKKLGVISIVLMMFSVIFGFTNPALAFFRMGYASIIWYVFGAFVFFLPLMFVSAEFAVSFKNEKGGGIYTWMRRSRGELYGFVGTFMWYFSVIIWFTGISARFWVPLSSFLFGEDRTKSWSILGLNSTQTLGIIGILLIVFVTFLATRGFDKISGIAKIGGISCTLINVLLYIVSLTILILNKGFFEEPIKGVNTFFKSPNPSHTPITLFAFVTFAIFAYGGIENLGSLVDKAKSAKTFSKACIIGTIIIASGYCIAIFFWGISANYEKMNADVNMGNVLYIFMRNLGYKLGLSMGMPVESALKIGSAFMRIVGISLLFCFLGAMFTMVYAPLKTLLDGAPKDMWPSFLTKKNERNMPQNAMWMQALIICLIIAIISIFGKGLANFFEILQLLSNIAQSIPYIFIVAAFPAFRRNENLNHEYKVFKSTPMAILVSTISFLVISVAVLFTILEPALSKEQANGQFQTLCMLIFPIVFFAIAFIIFNSYKKRNKLN